MLWVGRHEKTAHVLAFDLDGRRLGPGFSFRDPARRRSAVAGLCIDDDHRIWVGDGPTGQLLGFSIFGTEIARLGSEHGPEMDYAGHLGHVVDVARGEQRERAYLAVASRGTRRHAVQRFDPEKGVFLESLRPLGDPQDRFRGVGGVAVLGRNTYVSEAGAERIQVFRDADFHFAIRPAEARRPFRPTAVAPLADGRLVVATGAEHSSLLCLDSSGQLLGVLAPSGRAEGCVFEPNDVVVEEGSDDRHARVIAIDCDGDRVQIFNLLGQCYGQFESLSP